MLTVRVFSVDAGFGLASYRYVPFAPGQPPFAEFQAPDGSVLDGHRLLIREEYGVSIFTAGELVNLFLPRIPPGVCLIKARTPAA